MPVQCLGNTFLFNTLRFSEVKEVKIGIKKPLASARNEGINFVSPRIVA